LPSESTTTFPEKDELLQELAASKNQLNILLKQHEELEVKSKSDIKILVKEVKSLRKNRMELKQKLDVSLQERSEMEVGFGLVFFFSKAFSPPAKLFSFFSSFKVLFMFSFS